MPVSKRDKKVSLTKTLKKGMPLKVNIVEQIRQSLDEYNTLFVFNACNIRHGPMTEVREQWKGSRFFFAKRKVMAVALGRTEEEEIQKNLHKVAGYMAGDCGLLFTNKPKSEVIRWFEDYSVKVHAKAGSEATQTVTLPQGPMAAFTFSIEPHLRSLGMPTQLEKGYIVLREDFTVCTAGSPLTPEQSQILKLIDIPMAHFKLQLICLWSKDGSFEKFKAADEVKMATFKTVPRDRKSSKKVSTPKNVPNPSPKKKKNKKKTAEIMEEDGEEDDEEEEELVMQIEESIPKHNSPKQSKQSLENLSIKNIKSDSSMVNEMCLQEEEMQIQEELQENNSPKKFVEKESKTPKQLNKTPKSLNNTPRQQGKTPKNTPSNKNQTPKQTPIMLEEPEHLQEEETQIDGELQENKSPFKQFIEEERKTPKQLNKSLKSQNNTPVQLGKTPKSQNNTPIQLGKTPKSQNNTPREPGKTPKSQNNTPRELGKTPKSQNNTPREPGKTPKSQNNTPRQSGKTPKQTSIILEEPEEAEEANEQSPQEKLTKPSPKLGKGNPRRSMRTPKPIKRTPEQRRMSLKKLTESAKMTPRQNKATPKLIKDTPTDSPKRSLRKSRRVTESVDVEMAE